MKKVIKRKFLIEYKLLKIKIKPTGEYKIDRMMNNNGNA